MPTNSPPAATSGTNTAVTISDVIAKAESQIGQYSSVNKFNSWYGMPGSEWCDEFMSWVFNQSGAGAAIGGKFALCMAHAAWFKSKGRWTTTPETGALVFYDWSGGKSMSGIGHVGLVRSVSGQNIETVEGNTGNNQVANRTRSTQYVVGYGLPDMSGVGSAISTDPASLTSGLGSLSGVYTAIENIAKKLTDANFWRRVGLYAAGAVIIAIGVMFINRKRIESTATKVAEIGAMA